MAAAQSLLSYQPDDDAQPVIVAARRTPVGRAYGVFAGVTMENLLMPLFEQITELLPPGFTPVDEVIIGNATGGGGNIARLAALAAGLPLSVPAVTVDRQCGSGLEAVIQACRLVQARAGECYLAGGRRKRQYRPVAGGKAHLADADAAFLRPRAVFPGRYR